MQHLTQRQQFASAFLKDFILASPGSVQGLRVTQNHAICTFPAGGGIHAKKN